MNIINKNWIILYKLTTKKAAINRTTNYTNLICFTFTITEITSIGDLGTTSKLKERGRKF